MVGPIAESRKQANEIKKTRADHRRDRQSALQGKGQGPRRLDRVGGNELRRRPAPLAEMDAAAPIGASAPTPSTCATSTSISGAGRPGRSSTTTRRTTPASSASSPSPASSTARASRGCATTCAARPTTSGSSTVRPKAISPTCRRASSRACSSRSASCWRRGHRKTDADTPATVRYTVAAGREARGEVRGAGQAHARRSKAGRIARPIGERRSCPPRPATGRRYPALDELFALQRLGRHARPHLDHRPGRRIAATALADAHRRPARTEGGPVPSAHLRGRRARATSIARRSSSGACPVIEPRPTPVAERTRCLSAAGALRLSLVRPAVDHPRQPRHQSAQPELWEWHSERQVYLTALHRTFALHLARH